MIGLYIIWFRAFKFMNYELRWPVLVLWLVLQVASVGVGVFYYFINEHNNNLILTTFIAGPLILVTFTAFYGLWVANDYSLYQ